MKQILNSSNFFIAVVLFLGGLFVGFPEGEGRSIAVGLFGIIGSLGALRVYFKNAELNVKQWITNPNTWNYLFTILSAFFPILTPEMFEKLQLVAVSAIGGNWQGLINALVSLVTIIYFATKNAEPKAKAE